MASSRGGLKIRELHVRSQCAGCAGDPRFADRQRIAANGAELPPQEGWEVCERDMAGGHWKDRGAGFHDGLFARIKNRNGPACPGDLYNRRQSGASKCGRKPAVAGYARRFLPIQGRVFPNVIGFIGVRGDRNKEGKTLLTDNRKLYRKLDPADIQVLRSQKITWGVGSKGFAAHVIGGSESNPKFGIFEENLPSMGGFEKLVQGSPEAVAAYKRVKEIAASLVEGVWLGSGDVLLLNQMKASHGRSPYAAKYDGNDRWLQRTYMNSGGFWEAGIVQWPSRTLPFTAHA